MARLFEKSEAITSIQVTRRALIQNAATILLYHQSIMGSHSTVGQNEALYSSNTIVERRRLESSLPIYTQQLGEKDCAFYMMNKTCKYGDACKFDHPQWVPEGGIPNWEEGDIKFISTL